ncbi:hypothetical protein DRQ25_16870, partial [Candidatus Fermentibacteria bacterium]
MRTCAPYIERSDGQEVIEKLQINKTKRRRNMKTTTLSTKLIMAFAVVVVLFCAVIGVYHRTVVSVNSSYKSLIDTEIATADHAQGILKYMLQCRRNEKDFLLRSNAKYIDKLNGNYELLAGKVASIVTLANGAGDNKTAESAQELGDYAKTYLEKFENLADGMKVNGLTSSEGLQGAFRAAAHTIMVELAKFEIDVIETEYLLLRRWEKDYVRTNAKKYRGRLLSSLEKYETFLKSKTLSTKFRNNQEKALAAYADAFLAYESSEGEKRTAAYNAMRAAAHDQEKSLKSFYVPGAARTVLMIRRHEKDYLLRRTDKYVKRTESAVSELEKLITSSGISKDEKENLSDLLENYLSGFKALVAQDTQNKVYVAEMRDAVHKIEPAIAAFLAKAEEATKKNADTSAGQVRIALIIAAIAILVSICMAILIPRSITKRIIQIITGLSAASEQVTSASSQVASSSQQMAEGSSEQASSLEETSSS